MSEGYKAPIKNPAEEIRKLGMIIEEPSLHQEFHKPLQLQPFGELRPVAVGSFEMCYEACLAFLEGPTIKDQFGNDHNKRRAWRKTLSDSAYDFYEQNRLRLNVLSHIWGGLTLVTKQLDAQDIHTEQAEEMRRLVQEFPIEELKAYHTLSDEEKALVVSRVDAICTSFLTLVTQNT